MERKPGNNQEGDILSLNTIPVEGAVLRSVDGGVVEQVQVQQRRISPLHKWNRLSQNPM